ncbi:hypothetical protein HPB47_018444, partial [Ixodes persulcatus]
HVFSNTVSNSLTVVYAPTDSEKKPTSLSSLKITQALETINPECILQAKQASESFTTLMRKSPMKNWHNTYDQKPRLPTRDDLENLESSKSSSAAATSRAMSY